jgi:hypothetical protein
MCEFSGKLIAWLDGELPLLEAAKVGRHLESCTECRDSVDAFKQVSSELNAFCDAAVASSVRHESLPWVAAASAAGAAAALVALFLVWPRTQIQPSAFSAPQAVVTTSPAVAEHATPTLIRWDANVHRRRSAQPAQSLAKNQEAPPAPGQNENAYLVAPNEPEFQIAIPADEMFPPGAVPQGMNFVADVALAADGSAERLRLRPRLAGFERSIIQP